VNPGGVVRLTWRRRGRWWRVIRSGTSRTTRTKMRQRMPTQTPSLIYHRTTKCPTTTELHCTDCSGYTVGPWRRGSILENFLLVRKFLFKSTKFGAENPHFWEFWSKIEIFEHRWLILSVLNLQSCLSENCNFCSLPACLPTTPLMFGLVVYYKSSGCGIMWSRCKGQFDGFSWTHSPVSWNQEALHESRQKMPAGLCPGPHWGNLTMLHWSF